MHLVGHLLRGSDVTFLYLLHPSLFAPYAFSVRQHQLQPTEEVDEKVDEEWEEETWWEKEEFGIALIFPVHSSPVDSLSAPLDFSGVSFVLPSH